MKGDKGDFYFIFTRLILPLLITIMFVSGLLLAFVISFGQVQAAPRGRQALSCATSSFTNVVSLPGVTVTIEKVDRVSQGGSYQ